MADPSSTHSKTYSLPAPGFFANPYPFYRRLRHDDPVHWSDNLGAWLVTRYGDVSAGLHDSRLSSRRFSMYMSMLPRDVENELQPLRRFYESWLLFSDPPDHTRLKSVATHAMSLPQSPDMVDALRPAVDNLLIEAEKLGNVDIIAAFARPLSVLTVTKLIGIDSPDIDSERIATWSRDIVAFIGTGRPVVDLGRQAQKSLTNLLEYLRGIIVAARPDASASGGLLTTLLLSQRQGSPITDEEILMICANLLVDGHEPVTNLIGNGIHALLDNPEQLNTLRKNPSLLPTAVEELLRYNCPFQYAARRTTEPVQIGHRLLPRDARVLLMLGAANRDPEIFANPDRLDITRSFKRHRAFGLGPHYCLGAALGRSTTALAIGALLWRFPRLEALSQQLKWHQSLGFRGLTSFHISLNGSSAQYQNAMSPGPD